MGCWLPGAASSSTVREEDVDRLSALAGQCLNLAEQVSVAWILFCFYGRLSRLQEGMSVMLSVYCLPKSVRDALD